uniref:Aa_trans domain-containing protein n=1 Tax=Elaeophora elaphi TaxID=1147741 RepID=A0A0R3RPU7_9BILA
MRSETESTENESMETLLSPEESGQENGKHQRTTKTDGTTAKIWENFKIHSGMSSSGHQVGINWFMASIIILGDLVGAGIVAMPVAFAQTGFLLGILFMMIICAIFVTTGWLLAETWEIMRERWPEYRKHCRKPFPEMALRSMGKQLEIITKTTVYSTLFGATVVYMLLSSKIIQKFLANFKVNFNFCLLLILVTVSILPITFLKSPADFWWAILIAVVCTIITIVMIFVGISLDFNACYYEAQYSDISINSILGLGIFLFAFNGHQVFPTVQNDMRNPADFKKSILVGFIFVALLYMPLSAYAFLVYGMSMANSVTDSVQTAWIRHVADLSLAIHCILAIIITVNPINLQLEDTFDVPRSGCVILPTLYNIYIKAATYDKENDIWIMPTFREVLKRTPKMLLSIAVVINVITAICSVIATVLSVKEILGVRLIPPCYVLPFLSRKNRTQLGADVFNCCGVFMNISKFNDPCGAR